MKNKGFTLLELMIVIGLFSIFSMFIFRAFVDEEGSFLFEHKEMDMYYYENTALDYINSEIRNHAGLYVDSSENRIYSDASKTGILIDYSGTGTNGDINFDSNSDTLKDKSGNIICRNIEALSFDLEGSDSEIVDTDITLSTGSGARKYEYSINSSINYKK